MSPAGPGPWSSGVLVPVSPGRLVFWSPGLLVSWSADLLLLLFAGLPVPCSPGLLVSWSLVSSVLSPGPWSPGLHQDSWSLGLLVCWSPGLLSYPKPTLNQTTPTLNQPTTNLQTNLETDPAQLLNHP